MRCEITHDLTIWQNANAASAIPTGTPSVTGSIIGATAGASSNNAFGMITFSRSTYGTGTIAVPFGAPVYSGANPVIVLTAANDQAAFSTNGLEKYWVEWPRPRLAPP